MSEINTQAIADSSNSITVTNPTQETPPPATDPIVDPAFERMKADMAKWKARAQQLETDAEKAKLDGLKRAQNWEEVAKVKEQEASEYKTKYEGLSRSLVEEKKFAALKTEALKMGINPASIPDLELLDFAELSVETTNTGKIMVSGADRAIANLKTIRPHWFSAKPAGINPNSPETQTPQSGNVSLADINNAEQAYKKAPTTENKRVLVELIQKFKNQN